MSTRNSDFVLLGNGGIAPSAASPGPLTPRDGDLAAPQLTPGDAPRTTVSPNGCPQVNGTVHPALLPLDSPRAPQMLSPCCHPCPCHRPATGHSAPPECPADAGPASPPAVAPCCLPPCEYPAPLCAHHAAVYQAACCLPPSAAFCLHRPWPEHFPHQPVRRHLARGR